MHRGPECISKTPGKMKGEKINEFIQNYEICVRRNGDYSLNTWQSTTMNGSVR